MDERSPLPRLTDIVEAIGHVRSIVSDTALATFEADWQKRWLVERGLEIISEASRRLPDDLKDRHPGIPWRKVAGIGNILRHDYERVAPDLIWKLVRDDLAALERACRDELARLTELP